MKVAKVSVLLTSYNRDKLLNGAIQSVLTNGYENYHLYITDDDSENPKTHEVLNSYIDHPNVTVFKNKLNGVDRYSRNGYATNLNKILVELKSTETKYVTYLTCDDIYLPGRLKRMARQLDQNSSQYVVYGVQRIVKLHPNLSTSLIALRNAGLVVAKAACQVDHCSVMHRIECVQETKFDFWPPHRGSIGAGDAALWIKLNKKWPFYRLADSLDPTDEHRLHKNSIQKLG